MFFHHVGPDHLNWEMGAAFPLAERIRMNTTIDRADFTYKVWMAAGALVTAVITTFLLLALLSPDVNIDVAGVRSSPTAGGD
jgi:hypothetical protein